MKNKPQTLAGATPEKLLKLCFETLDAVRMQMQIDHLHKAPHSKGHKRIVKIYDVIVTAADALGMTLKVRPKYLRDDYAGENDGYCYHCGTDLPKSRDWVLAVCETCEKNGNTGYS